MFGDITKLKEMKDKINSVSPCFCLAKWMHVTIHLGSGHTHSCYLPQTHKIPTEEIAVNPSALHNTNYKKIQRRKMLQGVRPTECGICWGIEDLPGEQVSDRHWRSIDSWTMPFFDKVRQMPWDADINPTYVEVSFNSLCNFKCSYCSPHVSTSWEAEIDKMGPYKLSAGGFQDVTWLRREGYLPIPEDQPNPYVDAFWKWWPDLVKDLMYFRVTGGEPLLSKNTYRLLDWLNQNPQPHLELSINSNMGGPTNHIERFIETVGAIMEKKKLKTFILHTSLDTWGKQAEYIRNGLDLPHFEKNLKNFLRKVPEGSVAFMSTFNNLSIVNYKEFLKWIIELRREFATPTRSILVDIPHLMGPKHQCVKILTERYQGLMEDLIKFMEDHLEGPDKPGIKKAEIDKMRRILGWMQSPSPDQWLLEARRDFYLYFKEHDRRRNTDFLKTFPEMEDFWKFCESLIPSELRPKG